MSEDNTADAQYLFGHSEEETRRLLLQGRLFIQPLHPQAAGGRWYYEWDEGLGHR
jgi:hypothetical protein